MTSSNSPVQATAIDRMARWASALQFSDLPSPVIDIARDCLLDTFGVMAAGSVTQVAIRARSLPAGAGPCVVVGTALRADVRNAALFNGVAAHALDFDDNCYAGFVHGSAVIAPAALAMAQHTGANGGEMLAAFVAGAECEYAVGQASANVLYERGWWTTGVLGPVGACVAAARLLRLDAAQTASALGLALCGAGGLKACFGTDAKPFMAGLAAQAGVTAALMAAAGASGPADALEHGKGFWPLFNEGHAVPEVFDRLGQDWLLLQPGVDVKRIPVCLSSHAAVDVVMQLVHEHGIQAAQVGAIVCDVPPIVIANLIHDAPATPQQAQFSMPFAIAASLLHGHLGLEHLSPATLQDAPLRALMAKVSMHSSALWDDAAFRVAAPEGAEVSIALQDGRVVSGMRDFARGAARYRLGRDELEAKFNSCLRFGGLAQRASQGQWLSRLQALETDQALASLLA